MKSYRGFFLGGLAGAFLAAALMLVATVLALSYVGIAIPGALPLIEVPQAPPVEPVPVGYPGIDASPTTGAAGVKVTVNGTRFPARSKVDIYLGTSADDPNTLVRSGITTNGRGEFNATITMPVRWSDDSLIGSRQVVILATTPNRAWFSWTTFTFQPEASAPPTSIPVLDTPVEYVMALQDVIMRTGPDVSYPQVGGVFDGQIALVTGASLDGQWWRVICPDDTVGNCWVSADPALTQPTTPPGS